MENSKDLSQADLSRVKDENASTAQRVELERRFDQFVEAMRAKGKGDKALKERAKTTRKRVPDALSTQPAVRQPSSRAAPARKLATKWHPAKRGT